MKNYNVLDIETALKLLNVKVLKTEAITCYEKDSIKYYNYIDLICRGVFNLYMSYYNLGTIQYIWDKLFSIKYDRDKIIAANESDNMKQEDWFFISIASSNDLLISYDGKTYTVTHKGEAVFSICMHIIRWTHLNNGMMDILNDVIEDVIKDPDFSYARSLMLLNKSTLDKATEERLSFVRNTKDFKMQLAKEIANLNWDEPIPTRNSTAEFREIILGENVFSANGTLLGGVIGDMPSDPKPAESPTSLKNCITNESRNKMYLSSYGNVEHCTIGTALKGLNFNTTANIVLPSKEVLDILPLNGFCIHPESELISSNYKSGGALFIVDDELESQKTKIIDLTQPQTVSFTGNYVPSDVTHLVGELDVIVLLNDDFLSKWGSKDFVNILSNDVIHLWNLNITHGINIKKNFIDCMVFMHQQNAGKFYDFIMDIRSSHIKKTFLSFFEDYNSDEPVYRYEVINYDVIDPSKCDLENYQNITNQFSSRCRELFSATTSLESLKFMTDDLHEKGEKYHTIKIIPKKILRNFNCVILNKETGLTENEVLVLRSGSIIETNVQINRPEESCYDLFGDWIHQNT